jgi:hypothetical protein
MDTSNFDDSEAHTTAEEFDAMWDKGAPVEAVTRIPVRATRGAPNTAHIVSGASSVRLGPGTLSTARASTVAVSPAKPLRQHYSASTA